MSEQTLNFTQLVDTFQLFDKNKDGCISANEVNQLLFFLLKKKKTNVENCFSHSFD